MIISFTGNRVSIRKVDGAVLFAATSSDITLLYELTRAGRWDESLRLVKGIRCDLNSIMNVDINVIIIVYY